jgi:hypothetical protein
MQDVKQKIDELSLRLEKLIEVIRLPEKKKKIEELEATPGWLPRNCLILKRR